MPRYPIDGTIVLEVVAIYQGRVVLKVTTSASDKVVHESKTMLAEGESLLLKDFVITVEK